VKVTLFEIYRVLVMLVLTYLNLLNLVRHYRVHRRVKNKKSHRKLRVGEFRMLSTIFFWLPVPGLLAYSSEDMPQWAANLGVFGNSAGLTVMIGIGWAIKKAYEEAE
jgi:hypothetical protein